MTLEDIALTLVPGLGHKGTVYLLGLFGSAERIFAATESELIEQAELRPEIVRSIVRKDMFRQAGQEMKFLVRHGITGVASTDGDYPPLLRECPDYPHMLYVLGNPRALPLRSLSMVGTRKFTQYGLRMCDELVHGLSERMPGLCIVSGLAFGVDVNCHRAALRYGLPTVAVIANTLPDITPAQHEGVAREIVEKGGAIVTELHSQTRQNGALFLSRNRIIAGMSEGTVVVESPRSGGSLSTAQMADGYDRTVMAVPGRVGDKYSEGTNGLIRKSKARLVASGEDIVQELMWDVYADSYVPGKQPVQPQLTDLQRRVVGCFARGEEAGIDALALRSGLSIRQLMPILLDLEFEGVVRALPGKIYVLLHACD